MSAYSYELNLEYEYFFLITIPTTSLFFKKYLPKVFHIDNYCISEMIFDDVIQMVFIFC